MVIALHVANLVFISGTPYDPQHHEELSLRTEPVVSFEHEYVCPKTQTQNKTQQKKIKKSQLIKSETNKKKTNLKSKTISYQPEFNETKAT